MKSNQQGKCMILDYIHIEFSRDKFLQSQITGFEIFYRGMVWFIVYLEHKSLLKFNSTS